MNLVEAFSRNLIKHAPFSEPLLHKINSKRNFFLHYPIQLRATKSNRLVYVSMGHIRADNTLWLMSEHETFVPGRFPGSSPMEASLFREHIEAMQSKYDILTSEVMDRIQIILQIMANNKSIEKEPMPLKLFTDYLQHFNKKDTSMKKIDINSRLLMNIYNSSKQSLTAIYEGLENQFLKRSTLEQFLKWYYTSQIHIREDQGLMVLSPFLSHFDHSHQPNCRLDCVYLTHLRQEFVIIQTIRDIAPGDRLRIKYGEYGNIEMMHRFGFTVEANPYSNYKLIVDYSDIAEVLQEKNNEKQNLLRRMKMKLDCVVNILSGGQLQQQDKMMLRVLFGDGSESSINNADLDERIFRFLASQAMSDIGNLKVDPLRKSVNPHMVRIEEEQESILQALIDKHSL